MALSGKLGWSTSLASHGSVGFFVVSCVFNYKQNKLIFWQGQAIRLATHESVRLVGFSYVVALAGKRSWPTSRGSVVFFVCLRFLVKNVKNLIFWSGQRALGNWAVLPAWPDVAASGFEVFFKFLIKKT